MEVRRVLFRSPGEENSNCAAARDVPVSWSQGAWFAHETVPLKDAGRPVATSSKSWLAGATEPEFGVELYPCAWAAWSNGFVVLNPSHSMTACHGGFFLGGKNCGSEFNMKRKNTAQPH